MKYLLGLLIFLSSCKVMICQDDGPKVYHSHKCSGLALCHHDVERISKALAIKQGYTACPDCYQYK